MTYEQLTLGICPSVKSTPEVFRAKVSALTESAEVSQILEELYSLRLCGWLKSDTLNIYSLRTSADYSTTTEGIPSRLSYQQWTSWGIAWSGKCLTAEILDYRKTASACLLSDILEELPDTRYYLSQAALDRLLTYEDTEIITE